MLFVPLAAPNAPPPVYATLISGGQGPEAIRHAVAFWICENPGCPCSLVHLGCLREPPNTRDRDPARLEPTLRFALDVIARTLNVDPGHIETRALGEELVAALKDEDWEWLQDLFRATKARQLDSMIVETVAVEFPPEIRAEPGLMMAYADLFPWAESLQCEISGHPWIVEDLYCTRPHCPCTSILFRVFRQPDPGASLNVGLDSILEFRWNLASHRSEILGGGIAAPSPAAIVHALRTANPAFDAFLRQRHLQIQRLSQRFLSDHPTPDAASAAVRRAAPKIGRNEPCPCGSGRKFKHCCGKPK